MGASPLKQPQGKADTKCWSQHSCCTVAGGEEVVVVTGDEFDATEGHSSSSTSPRPSVQKQCNGASGQKGNLAHGELQLEKAFCLFYSVVYEEESRADAERLFMLHREVTMCCDLVGAMPLRQDATTGMILGQPKESVGMSSADVLLRMGQLVCRWAKSLSPPMGVRVGIGVGALKSVNLPGGRWDFFGPACRAAKQLAMTSYMENHTHLSKAIKDQLVLFEHVRLIISPARDSFYLDPATVVRAYLPEDSAQADQDGQQSNLFAFNRISIHEQVDESVVLGRTESLWDGESLVMQDSTADGSTLSKAMSGGRLQEMSLEEFKDMLKDYKVDISLFGKGPYKSLEEFYRKTMAQRVQLVFNNDKLERVLQMVRISLRMRSDDNRLRELRIASQVGNDGRVVSRNQKLAMLLQVPEGMEWRLALDQCFEEKLHLKPNVQKKCLNIEAGSVQYSEEYKKSQTIPGIMTLYKSYDVTVNITDRHHKDLKHLGLPNGLDFTTHYQNAPRHWTWAIVGDTKEDELTKLLIDNNIEIGEFAPEAFAELFQEVFERGETSLEVMDGRLIRRVQVLKLWMRADILTVEHCLVRRSKVQRGRRVEQSMDNVPISMKIAPCVNWEDAVEVALWERLGIPPEVQARNLFVDFDSYTLSEQMNFSRSYPGLRTVYTVNEVTVRILNPHDPELKIVGLPDGTDFTFVRKDHPGSQVSGWQAQQVTVCRWCWKPVDDMQGVVGRFRSVTDEKGEAAEKKERRRLDPPAAVKMPCKTSDGTGIKQLMQGRQTDWTRARNAASKMRYASYTCRDFYGDVTAAFPELDLYMADEEGVTTSGRTLDDEYQRTMGALFAVFWLMRLHLDGSESFCYGLDSRWQARRPPGPSDGTPSKEMLKRMEFHMKTPWQTLERLFVDAGILPHGGAVEGHDVEQTLGLLVLTAIHDIMKIQALLPRVAEEHGDYCGYEVGDTIHDHDVALSYVLTYYPEWVPSFAGLPKNQQQTLLFTQAKMEYNMGWLVQAEAPPGILFGKLRAQILNGNASARDVAFYFSHWFTDLAGGEPYPMDGCEKFVLKFPQKVLVQFLDSFGVVAHLRDKNQTQVLEEYLNWRWTHHDPFLGHIPTGAGAIAKMRIIIMAQKNSEAILKAWTKLDESDRLVLQEELAMTGCQGQSFSADPVKGKGPAILMYYSPAFMQKAAKEDPKPALMILAELFRKARRLWPATAADESRTVTVRIDVLKDLEASAILKPETPGCWIMERSTARDGVVMRVADYPNSQRTDVAMLSFSGRNHSFNYDRPKQLCGVVSGLAPVKVFAKLQEGVKGVQETVKGVLPSTPHSPKFV